MCLQQSAGFLLDQAGFPHDFAGFDGNRGALSGVLLLCRRLLSDPPECPRCRRHELTGATLDSRTEAKHVGSDPQGW
jgi:hypothetical protein